MNEQLLITFENIVAEGEISHAAEANLEQTPLKTFSQKYGKPLLKQEYLLNNDDNITTKADTALIEQFLLLLHCSKTSSAAVASESDRMLESVKLFLNVSTS